jgi:TusE/DsrC/DsvC family sulfur relay protein
MPEQTNIALDEDGFVTNPEQWDRDIAMHLATRLGVPELTDDHWQVMDYMRKRCLKNGALCAMEVICHGVNMEGNCVRRLFGGPVEAWKIAGLPHPGTEALTYMLDEE